MGPMVRTDNSAVVVDGGSIRGQHNFEHERATYKVQAQFLILVQCKGQNKCVTFLYPSHSTLPTTPGRACFHLDFE